MDIQIEGYDYNINFNYSVITALLKKMEIESINAVIDFTNKLNPTEIHLLLHEAIKTGKKKGDAAPLPSINQVIDAINEDISLSGQFINGILASIGKLLPAEDTTATEIETGN